MRSCDIGPVCLVIREEGFAFIDVGADDGGFFGVVSSESSCGEVCEFGAVVDERVEGEGGSGAGIGSTFKECDDGG